MLEWFGENLGTIAVCAVLIMIVCAIIAGMIKDRKKGKSPICGGSCGHCAMGCACSAAQRRDKE